MNYEQSLAMEGEGNMADKNEGIKELLSVLEKYRHNIKDPNVETISYARGYDDAIGTVCHQLREILEGVSQ